VPWAVAMKNEMLDQWVTSKGPIYASLHTGAPGSTGANEATGGSPAYARKVLAFSASSAGAKALSGAVIFDIPAGTYSYVGFWLTASGSTGYRGYELITPATFASQDVYALAAGAFDLNQVASA
jgi:hypothetical protein